MRGKEPKDEVQIYTWKDATLRELTVLVFSLSLSLSLSLYIYICRLRVFIDVCLYACVLSFYWVRCMCAHFIYAVWTSSYLNRRGVTNLLNLIPKLL